MATYQGIMLSKSPFYLVENGTSGFTSTMELRVWNGDRDVEPTDPTYSLNKTTLLPSKTSVTYEISKLVQDSFTHNNKAYDPNPSSERTESLWVNVKSFNGNVNRDDTWLATDGYSDFLEGINYQPPETIGALLSNTEVIYQYPGLPLRVPAYTDNNATGDTAYNIVATREGGTPIAEFFQIPDSTNSYDWINYTELPTGLTYTTITVNGSAGGVDLNTLTVKQLNCNSIHTPYICTFINKYGAYEDFIFSLASRENLSFDSEQFNKQLLDTSTGTPTFDTGKHQRKRYNVQETREITLNSDWIEESSNETMRQLMGSEDVWLTVDGSSFPVNVKTQSLQFKTRAIDGLIQYSMTFEYAFDIRNTIY